MNCDDIYKAAEACICLSFYEEATVLYEKYIKNCNASDPAAWHGLANALEELNKRSEEAYERAYELYDEGSWSSCLWKGWCAMKLGRYEEAARLFKKSANANDKYPYTYQSLALAMMKLGRKDEAKKFLERFRALSNEIRYEDRICEGYALLKSIESSDEIEQIMKKARALADKKCR